MPTFDVSGLQPEARAAAKAAAGIALRHLGDDLITVVAHGSAVKGGFIAGCSDLDLRCYVRPQRLTSEGSVAFEATLRLYHELARIATQPFAYLQVYLAAAGGTGGEGSSGFIPGAYHIIYGVDCVPLATATQLRRNARTALRRLDVEAEARRIGEHLLGGGRTSYTRELRWLCTDVWPALYHVLTLGADDPLAVWRLAKPEAIARTDMNSSVGASIRQFWRALTTHYATGEALPTALAALEAGVAFLRAAQCWYTGKEYAP